MFKTREHANLNLSAHRLIAKLEELDDDAEDSLAFGTAWFCILDTENGEELDICKADLKEAIDLAMIRASIARFEREGMSSCSMLILTEAAPRRTLP